MVMVLFTIHVLLPQVTIQDVTDTTDVVVSVGSPPPSPAGEGEMLGGGELDPRCSSLGYRTILRSGVIAEDASGVGSQTYTILRFLAGLGEGLDVAEK